jgi:hypothetical protein
LRWNHKVGTAHQCSIDATVIVKWARPINVLPRAGRAVESNGNAFTSCEIERKRPRKYF